MLYLNYRNTTILEKTTMSDNSYEPPLSSQEIKLALQAEKLKQVKLANQIRELKLQELEDKKEAIRIRKLESQEKKKIRDREIFEKENFKQWKAKDLLEKAKNRPVKVLEHVATVEEWVDKLIIYLKKNDIVRDGKGYEIPEPRYTTKELLTNVFKLNLYGITKQVHKRRLGEAMTILGYVHKQSYRDKTKGYYWELPYGKGRVLVTSGYGVGSTVKKTIPTIAQTNTTANRTSQTQEPMHIFNFKDIPERFNIFLKNRTPDQLKNGFTVDEAALELNCLPMNISDLVKQNPNLERRVKTIVGYYYDIPKAQIEKKNQPMTALELSTYADLYDLEDLA